MDRPRIFLRPSWAAIAIVTLTGGAAVSACVSSTNDTSSGDDAGLGFDGSFDSSTVDGTVNVDSALPPTDSGQDANDGASLDAGNGADAADSAPAPLVYCAPLPSLDAGAFDADIDADAAALEAIDASPQVFGPHMAGCPGIVSWNDRATLCGSTCTPCSAAQWVAQHGTTAPAFDYWTNDDLGYGGDFNSGSVCFAYAIDAGAASCSGDDDDSSEAGPTPMRVCYSDPVHHPYESVPDPLGNYCNWSDCAYGNDASVPDAGPDAAPDAAAEVFDFMGGCEDNLTAGTLCCCP